MVFFINLEKAYDRVSRKVLWWTLGKKQVSCKNIDVVKDTYNGAVISVRIEEGN